MPLLKLWDFILQITSLPSVRIMFYGIGCCWTNADRTILFAFQNMQNYTAVFLQSISVQCFLIRFAWRCLRLFDVTEALMKVSFSVYCLRSMLFLWFWWFLLYFARLLKERNLKTIIIFCLVVKFLPLLWKFLFFVSRDSFLIKIMIF